MRGDYRLAGLAGMRLTYRGSAPWEVVKPSNAHNMWSCTNTETGLQADLPVEQLIAALHGLGGEDLVLVVPPFHRRPEWDPIAPPAGLKVGEYVLMRALVSGVIRHRAVRVQRITPTGRIRLDGGFVFTARGKEWGPNLDRPRLIVGRYTGGEIPEDIKYGAIFGS